MATSTIKNAMVSMIFSKQETERIVGAVKLYVAAYNYPKPVDCTTCSPNSGIVPPEHTLLPAMGSASGGRQRVTFATGEIGGLEQFYWTATSIDTGGVEHFVGSWWAPYR